MVNEVNIENNCLSMYSYKSYLQYFMRAIHMQLILDVGFANFVL